MVVMPTKPQHARRYVRVPKLLRALRDQAGLSQRQLAKQVSQPQSWVYKSECGIRRVDIAEFCEWCRACGVLPESAIRSFLRG